MGCGKKTKPIDTATNLATLEMAGTHWQLTVDDQGNAVWTAARSAGAEGPDTDRARDLKLSASVDVSELATDPMACENPDQASFSDFVPSSVRAVIRNCPMELDEDFLKAPMGERPPLPGPAAQSRTALTRRRRPKSSKAAIARCGSPVVKAHGSPSGVILCWNHFTRDLSGLGTSEHQPPTHAWSACLPAPASDAPVHGSVGANGDASGNLWLKSFPKRMANARTSLGGLPEVVQAFFQLQKGWRKGFVNGHAEVAH